MEILEDALVLCFLKKNLWKDVQENAINAAIHDFRFSKLTEEEFSKIKIEVSVLSLPKKIDSVK